MHPGLVMNCAPSNGAGLYVIIEYEFLGASDVYPIIVIIKESGFQCSLGESYTFCHANSEPLQPSQTYGRVSR